MNNLNYKALFIFVKHLLSKKKIQDDVTCMSLGTIPASTAALLAPTAAPNLSARSYNMVKLSPDFIPRPPLTTTLAEARSGLSLLLSSWPTNSDEVGKSPEAAGASSTDPEPPAAQGSKAVDLTVKIYK